MSGVATALGDKVPSGVATERGERVVAAAVESSVLDAQALPPPFGSEEASLMLQGEKKESRDGIGKKETTVRIFQLSLDDGYAHGSLPRFDVANRRILPRCR